MARGLCHDQASTWGSDSVAVLCVRDRKHTLEIGSNFWGLWKSRGRSPIGLDILDHFFGLWGVPKRVDEAVAWCGDVEDEAPKLDKAGLPHIVRCIIGRHPEEWLATA